MIEIVVEAGGKVVERRLLTADTPASVIKAQLQAAKAQGAKFVGVKAPKEAIIVNPFTGQQLQPSAVGLVSVGQVTDPGQLSAQALGVDPIADLVIPAELRRAADVRRRRQPQPSLFAEGLDDIALSGVRQAAQTNAQTTTVLDAARSAQDSAFRSAQAQSPFQAQATDQAQMQRLSQVFGFGEPVPARPRRRVLTRAGPRARPRLGPGLPLPIFGEEPARKPAVAARKPGYDVFALREGRVQKLNKVPRSRTSALSIGGSFTDLGPAASFTIKKAGKPASGPEIDTWGAVSHKFRPRRTKKALKLVEKRKFRIDSLGELQGVTFKSGKKSKKKGGVLSAKAFL
jgi:hypothetical protein